MTPELKAELAAIDDVLCDYFIENFSGKSAQEKCEFLDIIYRLRATYDI